MAFYQKICPETICGFYVEDEGILHWQKSVVIHGVYKSPPKRRGGVEKEVVQEEQVEQEPNLPSLQTHKNHQILEMETTRTTCHSMTSIYLLICPLKMRRCLVIFDKNTFIVCNSPLEVSC